MNWEDIRLFLVLARNGSARATAAKEGMSHSTVTRRVDLLESDLGVRLFDRDVRGYRLTAAGETMLASTVQAEDALLTARRQLQGRDAQLSGEIRLTISDTIATYFLMPHLVEFSETYRDIDLNVLIANDLFNLSRREADVALRFMRVGSNPPEDLIGRNIATISSCYYASDTYLAKNNLWGADCDARWIGWDDEERFPDWVKASPFPQFPVYSRFNNVLLQAEATRCGMGLGVLPCFVGDKIEGVIRIPTCEPYHSFDIWVLSHPDLRDATRLRTFRAFIADVVEQEKGLLSGASSA
ncbi:MAG: DNA-binding transcriptional LysR family regulator [Gammaproteobacteria bacterium]|jgi:DNA-binding transcriptional LysR family regulator